MIENDYLNQPFLPLGKPNMELKLTNGFAATCAEDNKTKTALIGKALPSSFTSVLAQTQIGAFKVFIA